MLRRIPGFTLIELLVVVTIIVVLLALLVPAMDKAIYQAELAMCASRLDAVATSAITYTAAHRRSYPHRTWVGQVPERAMMLSWMPPDGASHDDRIVLSQYFDVDSTLNCPLTETIALEQPEAHADTSVFSPYGLWFGFNYKGYAGLKRYGDRLAYLQERFDVLAGDWDGMYEDTFVDVAAHPDRDGRMFDSVVENQPAFYGVAYKASWSLWHFDGDLQVRRGLSDTNYAFTDGSVSRYNGVRPLDQSDNDIRMSNLPARQGLDNLIWRVNLPKR